MRKQLSNSKSVMILAAWGALIGYAHRKHLRSKQADPSHDRSLILKTRKRWMDHPLVAWIVENGLVWAGTLGKLLIFGLPHPRRSRLHNFLVSLGGFMFADRFLMLTNWLVTHKLYSHIPFFNSKGPHPFTSARKQFWEFVQLIVVSHIALAALFVSKVEASKTYKLGIFRPDWSLGRDLRKFSPLAFCAKLAIARTVVDVLFFIGHWIIHRPVVYKQIHKLHHEHHNPSVLTNQHFSHPDIWIEAYAPTIAVQSILFALGIHTSLLEETLLIQYVGWQESQSHAGKPLPTTTLVAPLAPLYHWLIGDVDRRNVEFHEVHHNKLHCNYSILPWVDHLMGTSRFY